MKAVICIGAMALGLIAVGQVRAGEAVLTLQDKNGRVAKVSKEPVQVFPNFVMFDAQFHLGNALLTARVLASCKTHSYAYLASSVGDIGANRLGEDESQWMPAILDLDSSLDVPKIDNLKKHWCSRPSSPRAVEVPVAADSAGNIRFVRLDTIRNLAGAREAWVIERPGKTEPVMNVDSDGHQVPVVLPNGEAGTRLVPVANSTISKARYLIKCKDQTMAVADAIDYNTDGSVRRAEHGGGAVFDPIVPDTVGEDVSKFLCSV